ncbi:MAG: class I mannose-6-phosphate isomerase [Christensenellaceae bacterium]|jgi:mannose-6-phosphate isomerase|nr:class I mannose-6-phosphate isomerase [Christensenellaceae bacterium]
MSLKTDETTNIQESVPNTPLLLKPVLKDYIWGGSLLASEWGKDPNGYERIAESWELSCLEGNESCVQAGIYAGNTLNQLNLKFKGILGKRADMFGVFPALIKIIDASADLSIQVHPSDEYAREVEHCPLGKTEMWYVAEAQSNAYIYLGFNKKQTSDELRLAIAENRFCELLKKIKIKKGDFFFIPSGTVHALLAGAVIVEIQESSNLTYRIYDYGRKDTLGMQRDLHIDKALDVICTEAYEAQPTIKSLFENDDYVKRELVNTDYFDVSEVVVNSCYSLVDLNKVIILTAIEGCANFVNGGLIKKGDTFFIRPGLLTKIEGKITFIETNV